MDSMEENIELEKTKEFKPEELIPETDEELEVVVFDDKKEIVLENEEKPKKEKKDNIFKKLWNKFKNARKSIKVLIILIIVLVLIGLVFLVSFLIKNNKSEAEEKKEDPIVTKDNYRYQNGVLTILDDSDQSLGTYECENKDENLCYVAYELEDDNFNVSKKEFEDGSPYHKRSKVYNNKFVFIFDNAKEDDKLVRLYDLGENSEVETYLGVKSYAVDTSEYLVAVNNDNKYGLNTMSETGMANVLPFDYEYMGIIEGKDSVVVQESGKWGIQAFGGKTLARAVTDEIRDYNNNYILVYKDGYYVINYQKKALTAKYEFAELLDEYLITVDESNMLKVVDYQGNKMMEDGIKLTTEDYVKTLVYNEQGVNTSTKFAYTYELNGSQLNFKISNGTSEDERIVNLLEGKLSAKYSYYSYFDGNLYFYKDKAKTDFLGAYTCVNKNNVTANSKVFDKCYVAYDENLDDNDMVEAMNVTSVTPIYSNRLVFIRDALALASDNAVKVNLFNLDTKRNLGNYVSVNTYSKAENEAVYHEAATNKIVIAKTSSGKFGGIKIAYGAATSPIAFEYDSLEKMGSYFMGKKNNKWVLLDSGGTKLTSELSEQIRGYKGTYVKTKNNKHYSVYTFGGVKVSSDPYRYVELYDKFFAGVDDGNNLLLFNYKGDQVIVNSIPLESTNYYGTNKNAFTITVSGIYVTVKIQKESGVEEIRYNTANSSAWDRVIV